MKQILLALLTLLCCKHPLWAQDSSFVISGDMEKIRSGVLFLSIYENDKTVIDSTKIIAGKFTFRGYVQVPCFASLTLAGRKSDYFTFYVEPAQFIITGRGDSLNDLAVKNSPVNTDDGLLQRRLTEVHAWEQRNRELFDRAYRNDLRPVMDSLEEVDKLVMQKKRFVVADFVKENPHSLRAAMAILENFRFYTSSSELESLFQLLSPEIKQSPKGREIKSKIAKLKLVSVGKILPDIQQTNSQNKMLPLSSLRGKIVLVHFWASWCGSCRRENVNLKKAYSRFKNKRFTLYGVSYDSTRSDWIQSIQQDKLAWSQVSDLNGWNNSTSDQMSINVLPANFLLDKHGKIIAVNLFGKELQQFLEKLFK